MPPRRTRETVGGTMSATLVLAAAATALSLSMAAAWAVQRLSGNSGWIDTIWTFSLGTVGAAAALAPEPGMPRHSRQVLVAVLIASWSLRLGLHILRRTRASEDDPRYRKMMTDWGRAAPSKLFRFLQIQAAVSLLLCAALLLAARNPAPVDRAVDAIALVIFCTGVIGEAVADAQLRRFKARPENGGQICDVGLWRWSRHPNYFFEWLCWMAYPLLAVSSGHWVGLLAFAAPACMYWLLAHVSGIPLLEEHLQRTRGAAFAAYCARTSAFFPRPPRDEI
jgi:steroid 5-alpha reductase family enzyme